MNRKVEATLQVSALESRLVSRCGANGVIGRSAARRLSQHRPVLLFLFSSPHVHEIDSFDPLALKLERIRQRVDPFPPRRRHRRLSAPTSAWQLLSPFSDISLHQSHQILPCHVHAAFGYPRSTGKARVGRQTKASLAPTLSHAPDVSSRAQFDCDIPKHVKSEFRNSGGEKNPKISENPPS